MRPTDHALDPIDVPPQKMPDPPEWMVDQALAWDDEPETGEPMTAPVMLSLCDRTGAMCLPWAEAGYRCYALDIQHRPGVTEHPLHPNIRAVGGSVLHFKTWMLDDVAFVASFPPCTHLAVSGARWWEQKELDELARMYPDEPPAQHRARYEAGETPVFDGAMELVYACRDIAEASGAPWFVENPVGRIAQRWRSHDSSFDPFEYGGYEVGADDGYTKLTCLWTGGGFVMPPLRPIPLDPETHDRIHKAAPSPDRADIRSVTPRGFARAVFEWNRLGMPRAARQLALT